MTYTTIISFNEPDLSSQSNISPAAAAAAWKTYMEPFYGKATLVSPAITNGGAPMGTAWMDSFIAACTGCHIDKIAMHIYDSATNVAYYQSYITSVGTRYGRPVMVTEVCMIYLFIDLSINLISYFIDGCIRNPATTNRFPEPDGPLPQWSQLCFSLCLLRRLRRQLGQLRWQLDCPRPGLRFFLRVI